MINTFNCGVGFCVISPKKNIVKIKILLRINLNFMKLVLSLGKKTKVKISNSLKW